LWRGLKDKVYETKARTLEELSKNIRRETSTISGEELQTVDISVFCSYTEFIPSGWQQFPHLL
jgi:hypothetical protein